MTEKERTAAGAAADELKLDGADRLAQLCERAAASVETMPTPRQIVAEILRKIPAEPIHSSRRAEVAELVTRYESNMRNCADDAGRLKLAHELAEKIRFGGFRVEIGSTVEGFARREQAANGIRRTLAGLGWNGNEIEQAFLLAGRDERAFGNLDWDHVVLNGKRVERRAIQLAGKSVISSESDADYLRKFPAIRPPKPVEKPFYPIG
jgi:hypothetical protein